MKSQLVVCLCCVYFLVIINVSADDKSEYNLFHPTPKELMRPMSTDRPDLTESPYTVDAGHFQIEWDFLNYTYDRHQPDGGRDRIENYTIAPVNFKVGLLNNVDLQLVIESYIYERTTSGKPSMVSESDGFGDIITRVKVNLWGNDEGETALGVMPFVKFPSNQDDLGNDAVEGGIIFPFSMELPDGWSMGAQTELDFNEDSSESSYHVEFVNSIAFGRDIIGDLAGYIEFFSVISTEDASDWTGLIGTGFTYAVTDDVQLDGGINFGLTRAADELNPFVGMTVRF